MVEEPRMASARSHCLSLPWGRDVLRETQIDVTAQCAPSAKTSVRHKSAHSGTTAHNTHRHPPIPSFLPSFLHSFLPSFLSFLPSFLPFTPFLLHVSLPHSTARARHTCTMISSVTGRGVWFAWRLWRSLSGTRICSTPGCSPSTCATRRRSWRGV